MDIRFMEINENLLDTAVKMVTELMNYHRMLNNAPKEFWQTDEQSKETLEHWIEEGTVYIVLFENDIAGFFYIRFGGQNAAWLEDLFIKEEFRGKGIGKQAFSILDEMMREKGVISMFVNVIPRNVNALKFYIDCGFDHLNMIELRKNYDSRLNKSDEVEVLGFKLKKY